MWQELQQHLHDMTTIPDRAECEETDDYLRIRIPAKEDLGMVISSSIGLLVLGLPFLWWISQIPNRLIGMFFGGALLFILWQAVRGIVWNVTGREFLLLDRTYLTVGRDMRGWRRAFTYPSPEVEVAYCDPSIKAGYKTRSDSATCGTGRGVVAIVTKEKTVDFGLGISDAEALDIAKRINAWRKYHP